HLNRWCTVCRSRSQRTSSGGGTRPASDHHHVNSTSVELPGTKVAKFVTDYSEKHLASSTSKNTPLRSPTCCGAWQLLVAAHRIVLLSCAFFSQLVHCFLQPVIARVFQLSCNVVSGNRIPSLAVIFQLFTIPSVIALLPFIVHTKDQQDLFKTIT
uniref:Uncharacterized protein n=2 Tax=Aegilops tauschii subsp. strangulata TaxID=200361 RepID=A0A453I6W9_AEGTS